MRNSLFAAALLAFPAATFAQSPPAGPAPSGHGMAPPAGGSVPPSNYRPTPATRDADCFLVAAVGSQSIMANGASSNDARAMEPILRGTASYFAGRLATRLSGAALRQALAASSDVVRSPALRQLVGSCTGEFQAFMRSVSEPGPAAR